MTAHYAPGGLLDEPLLPLDVGEVVEGVGVGGGEAEGGVVAVLRLGDEPLLLERVGQVAVRVGEVGLQLDGAPVRVDRQVDQPEQESGLSWPEFNPLAIGIGDSILLGEIFCVTPSFVKVDVTS